MTTTDMLTPPDGGAGGGGGGGASNSAGGAAAPDAGTRAGGSGPTGAQFSVEDLEKVLEKSLVPVFQEVGGAMQGMAQRIEKMEGHGAGDPAAPADPDAVARQLLSDPDAVIDDKVAKALEKSNGPLFRTIVADRRDQHLRDAEKYVDDTFGDGAWSDMFSEDVTEIVKRFPPAAQLSRDTVFAAVHQVQGRKFTELSERVKKAAAEDPAGYHRLPPSRREPAPAKLTEEEAVGLRHLRDAGVDLSDDLYLKMKNIGPKRSDWEAVQAKKGG